MGFDDRKARSMTDATDNNPKMPDALEIAAAQDAEFARTGKLFDIILIITGGGPGTRTYTASFYLYQIGFQQFHLSQATAGSWLFLILSAVIVMFLVRRLLRPEPR